MFHVVLSAYTSAAREFMRLHPQEVFLTIHDDPNPISTIVSGALCFNARPPFSFCAVLCMHFCFAAATSAVSPLTVV